MCAFIESPRGRHGKESEKGKEGCSDEEGLQEDERQKEEIAGATSPLALLQPYRHLRRREERCRPSDRSFFPTNDTATNAETGPMCNRLGRQ
jgi:hypothetical protein